MLYVAHLILFFHHAPEKSAEKIEMLEGCIVSLNAKIGQLENSNQLFRDLKATFEEECRNHASVINDLESSIMDCVREKFSRVPHRK